MSCNLAPLFLLLLAGPAAESKPVTYARPELLIEATDLARLAEARDVRILDARPRPKYLAGHLPGALWVDHDAWGKAFATGQDRDAWAGRIGGLAIGPDMRVIVYDDSFSKDAARIWWILRYWGVKDVRLLNGGWPAWHASGAPVATGQPEALAAMRAVIAPESERLTTKAQLLEGLTEQRFQIIDARSHGEYCGDTKTAKRNGAIPGARHLEWIELLDPKSQRFKGPAELAKLFADAGIDLKRPTVTHCQSGGRAAVMAFGLELMGAKDVRNYYRSWAEWGNADDTPIDTPKK
jgi:thiosulfate/3-mercaptopyruvate sulfurtransferase